MAHADRGFSIVCLIQRRPEPAIRRSHVSSRTETSRSVRRGAWPRRTGRVYWIRVARSAVDTRSMPSASLDHAALCVCGNWRCSPADDGRGVARCVAIAHRHADLLDTICNTTGNRKRDVGPSPRPPDPSPRARALPDAYLPGPRCSGVIKPRRIGSDARRSPTRSSSRDIPTRIDFA